MEIKNDAIGTGAFGTKAALWFVSAERMPRQRLLAQGLQACGKHRCRARLRSWGRESPEVWRAARR